MDYQRDAVNEAPLRAVAGLAYSGGGRPGLLAVASLEAVGLWETEAERWGGVLEGQGARVTSVDWGMAGTRVACGGEDGRVWIWDVAGRSLLRTIAAGDRAVQARWQPGAERVATFVPLQGVTRIWDTASGELALARKAMGKRVDAVAFRGDGQVAATAEGKMVALWDAGSGETRGELAGHTDDVSAVAWRGDGEQLATVGGDRTLRVWDATTGAAVRVFAEAAHWGAAMAWHPDGQRLAATFQGSVRIWSVTEKKYVAALPGHRQQILAMDWSPDGKTLATGGQDGTVCLWDGETGEPRHTLTSQPTTNQAQGGREESVTEEEFRRLMEEMGAVMDGGRSGPGHYDMVTGNLLEGVWQWRTADGMVAGRKEEYSWRGEKQYVFRVVRR